MLFDYYLSVYLDVLRFESFDEVVLKTTVAGLDVQVLEREIRQAAHLLLLLGVEKGEAIHLAPAHGDVVNVAVRWVLAVQQVIELGQSSHIDEVSDRACDVLYPKKNL